MTLGKAASTTVLLIGALASGTAAAGNVRFGFSFGFPIFPPYWSYAPWYYAPPPLYYYPSPVVTAPAAPPAYVEQSQAAAPPAPAPAEHYWYYCADSQTYYPYVQQCSSEWQRVSPRPPGM